MSTTAAPLSASALLTATPEAMAHAVNPGWAFTPLWPSQRELLRAAREHRRIAFLKARQLRFTWTLALLMLWWAIDRPYTSSAYVSIGQRESEDVTRRMMLLHSSLPREVREAYPLLAESLSRLEIGHPEGGPSEILSLPSTSTAGRGKTLSLLVGDERPHWRYPEEQEASLLPAAAGGTVIMGGTANGYETFWARWAGAPANGWHPIFVGALADPSRTLEWVAREREAAGAYGPQEYPLSPEEAFVASGRCAFDAQSLQWLLEHSCEPPAWRGRLAVTHMDEGRDVVLCEAAERGAWRVWDWPRAGRSYLIAADACGGQGADYAAAAVYDTASWDQAAAFHGRVDPAELADELTKAGWLYQDAGRPALLVPEANNHGQAVVALLAARGYPNLYEREAEPERRRRTLTASAARLGFETTAKTRPAALATLKACVRDGSLGIRDADAVLEMRRFVVTETGREEADEGANDDRVLTHAIAAHVLARSPQSKPLPAVRAEPYVPQVSEVTAY